MLMVRALAVCCFFSASGTRRCFLATFFFFYVLPKFYRLIRARSLATGFFEIYGTHLNPENMEAGKEVQKGLPTLVYYSRKDAGTPKISPKAGNM